MPVEFLKSEEGFAANILASRLSHLVEAGILRREDSPDRRRDLYALTEKGLDLIPLLFEIVLWSAKHDGQSEARRIPRLMGLIRRDDRGISRETMEKVKRGEAIARAFA